MKNVGYVYGTYKQKSMIVSKIFLSLYRLPIGIHQKSTQPAEFWHTFLHFGIISVFLVVEPSLDSILACFSNESTMFRLL